MIFNYTDLSLTLTVDSEYLSDSEGVYVTFESLATETTIRVKPNEIDYETGDITVVLSQELTGKLAGETTVQVNGFLNGRRWASEQGRLNFRRNLLDRVIEDE